MIAEERQVADALRATGAIASVGSSWLAGCRVVDQERLDRLLDRVASDMKILDGYRAAAGDLLDDPTRLAAVKYHFITAIEGCARLPVLAP
ncbi:MAG: hypothetical protein ACREX8_16770 [Gammaproteobacteria bacterium]